VVTEPGHFLIKNGREKLRVSNPPEIGKTKVKKQTIARARVQTPLFNPRTWESSYFYFFDRYILMLNTFSLPISPKTTYCYC
jgi:hypothetical protein